MVFRIV